MKDQGITHLKATKTWKLTFTKSKSDCCEIPRAELEEGPPADGPVSASKLIGPPELLLCNPAALNIQVIELILTATCPPQSRGEVRMARARA